MLGLKKSCVNNDLASVLASRAFAFRFCKVYVMGINSNVIFTARKAKNDCPGSVSYKSKLAQTGWSDSEVEVVEGLKAALMVPDPPELDQNYTENV